MSDKISLVIPFYNEESNAEPVIKEAVEVLKELQADFEILAVDDGSTDETRYILDNLAKKYPQLKPHHHKKNKGYGGALETGIKNAAGALLLFVDGDGQFYMKELKSIIQNLSDYDVVLGYRINRQDPWFRKLNSAIYNWCARILIGVKIKDINCAMKGFRSHLFKDLKLRTNGAIINSDILSQILPKGVKFKEVGINHKPRLSGEQTGAKLKVILNAMREFINVLVDEFPKRKSQMLCNFRIFFGFVFAAMVLVFARPSDGLRFLVGMVIAAAGVFVRNWASGYLKKSQKLCTQGPYSIVRHPLYFGSLLIGLGVILSLWNVSSVFMGVIFTAILLWLFLFVYIPKINSEEKNLLEWFGDEFIEYKKNTGALLPVFKKVDLALSEFKFSLWLKNKEYQSIIGLALFYLVMYFKM